MQLIEEKVINKFCINLNNYVDTKETGCKF